VLLDSTLAAQGEMLGAALATAALLQESLTLTQGFSATVHLDTELIMEGLGMQAEARWVEVKG
jgi:hypothetical protein